jgi:carbamoyltransferase
MIILGLNCFHGDSSAAIVRNGTLVAAAEEKRFRRIKHWAGFPAQAIAYCLAEAGISLADVDHVAVNQDSGQILSVSCATFCRSARSCSVVESLAH